jgi:hypothetical protein
VLALATDTRPAALDSVIGQSADVFFATLARTNGPETLMALTSFSVP